MSIIKRVPDKIGFTMVSNQVLQHETMSLVARGLLAHLLSMPPDWKINVTHLLSQFSESRPCVHRAWQELKELGYVRKIQLRENGRIAGWDYEVSQDPEKQEASISTTLKNKNLASNNIANNNLATEGHIKKEETKQTKNKETEDNPLTPRGGNQTATPLVLDSQEERRSEKRIQIGKMELPTWISRESWQDFIQHRKALRKPMTARAAELILNRLTKIAAEHGETGAQLALLDAIANGWQSPYPPKDQAFRGQGNYQTASDRSNELLDRWLKEDDNGNQEHNRSSTQDLGSEHRANNPDGPARALAGGVQGGSGQPVHSGTEETASRDAGSEFSDDWASLGITAEPTPRRSLFG